ncbi:MAG: carbohydrate-binding protein [Frankiaceae bacterium]
MIKGFKRAVVATASVLLVANVSLAVDLLAVDEAVAATPTVESTTVSAASNFGATQGIGSWFNMKRSGGTYSYLSIYDPTYPANWKEPSGYPRVRDYYFHPETNAAAVKKWVAQQAGNVAVTGAIGKLDSRSSGVIATISKNTTVLWSATVPPSTYVTPTGVSDIHVEPGDALYFSIGVNGSMNFDETGWPIVVTETTALTIQAAGYDGMSGVTTSATSDTGGGSQVNSFDTGDYLLYRGINLSGGYKTLQARIAGIAAGAKFEVRLDSLTGPVVSTFTVANTDGWSTWETQTWPFSPTATGVHDLYVRGILGQGIGNLHWLRLAGTNSRGATEPFTTYEAEAGSMGGGAALNVLATVQQQAASGKSYVHLAGTGQYVQWSNVRDANRLILRYSIPQGTSGTLGLYVNGVKRTDLALSSTYDYDTEPGNTFIRSFDDQDFAVDVNAGDTVMLQKDAASTLPWYGIDLIDLETATAPLAMPTGYLSVKDYGAKGDGVTDDTTAIQSTVNAAASAGQSVWFPPGTYIQGDRITVPSNVNVKGAGVWWSHLHAIYVSHSWAVGFMLNNNTTLSDLRISGVDTQRNGYYDNAILTTSGAGQNDVLSNLWVQHTTVFTGWTDWTGSTISNCRVYDLYADGIHWGDGGPAYNLAANNYFRGMGDDSIAQVNFTNFTTSPHDNTAQFNTVIASYWGRGMADIGGNTLTYRDNVIDSTYLAGMMVATEPVPNYPYISYPINGLKFQRNTINLASHTGMNHAGLHFWLKTNPMSNVRIELNVISNGLTNGIWIDNTTYGDDGHTLFAFNTAQNNATGNYTNANANVRPTLNQNVGF